MRRCGFVLVLVFAFAGCAPAVRYFKPEPPALAPLEEKAALPDLPWMPVSAADDIPIHFIPVDDPEWPRLKEYWNHYPPLSAGASSRPDCLSAIVC